MTSPQPDAPARRPMGTPGGPKAVKRVLGYLRGYRWETAGALLSLLLVSAANLGAPLLIHADKAWGASEAAGLQVA